MNVIVQVCVMNTENIPEALKQVKDALNSQGVVYFITHSYQQGEKVSAS